MKIEMAKSQFTCKMVWEDLSLFVFFALWCNERNDDHRGVITKKEEEKTEVAAKFNK